MGSSTAANSSPSTLSRDAQTREVYTCELAIIGGGGAGLSLLWSLARQGYLDKHEVVLIEPEPKNTDDRTWCFWAKEEDSIVQRLSACISHAWTEAQAEGQVQSLEPYTYYQVRSADFYAEVKKSLADRARFTWIRESVTSEIDAEAGCIPLMDKDVKAQKIFDSRVHTPRKKAPKVELWQSFMGWRIRTSKPQFTPRRIELMNFEVPQRGETQFLYLLPTSEDEMLIEMTRFGQEKIDAEWAAVYLKEWLDREVGYCEILESETGAIPMSQSLDAEKPFHDPSARILPIGTAGGAVKPTTGYAFYQMVAHGEALAQAIHSKTPLPAIYRKPRYRFYDRLLLDILKTEPENGRPIFKQLFQRVKTPTVLTFLGENMRLREEVPLLLSLPISPFLRALDRQYTGGRMQALLELVSPRRWKKNLVFILAFLFFALQWIAPQATQILALPVLIGGLLFPGIPHGAVDHVLDGSAPDSPGRWLRFIAVYIAIMLAIVALWLLSPVVGLLLFLAYSAWHFGETDLKHMQAYHPGLAGVYGVSLLGAILLSHPEELAVYLHALGLPVIEFLTYQPLLLLLGLGMLLPVSRIPATRFSSYIRTLAIVALGAALPLLLAFALYFVGLHSWRAWRHLRSGLNLSDRQLLRAAAPFSIGAYLFAGAFVVLLYFQVLPFEGVPAALFLFLAAVSAPHIWMMHGFYIDQKAPK